MMKLGTETGSLMNHIYSTAKMPVPQVGFGATVLSWTDRYAGTIIAVRPDGSFDVQADKATRKDDYGISDCQRYSYEADPNGRVFTFAPVKRGKSKGQIRENGSKGGFGVLIGVRDQYYDYSF